MNNYRNKVPITIHNNYRLDKKLIRSVFLVPMYVWNQSFTSVIRDFCEVLLMVLKRFINGLFDYVE